MKSKHRLRGLVALLLLAAVAAGFVAAFPILEANSQANTLSYFDQPEFQETLCKSGYVQYWSLVKLENYQQRQREDLMGQRDEDKTPAVTPADVFFPYAVQSLNRRWMSGDYEARAVLDNLTAACEEIIDGWEREFHWIWSENRALVLRDRGAETLGGGGKELTDLALSVAEGREIQPETGAFLKEALFHAVLVYDGSGRVHPEAVGGADVQSLVLSEERGDNYLVDRLERYLDLDLVDDLRELLSVDMEFAAKPRGIIAAYAVTPAKPGDYSHFDSAVKSYELDCLSYTGFSQLYAIALVAAAVLGLVMILLDGEKQARLVRIPLEPAILLACIPIPLSDLLSRLLLAANKGEPLVRFGIRVQGDLLTFPPPGVYSTAAGYILSALLLLVLMGCVYAGVYSIGQVRWTGLRPYLAQRSLIVRGLLWCGRMLQKLYRWVLDIDLTDPGDKAVVKIVAANFVILTLLCCLWFFGIIGVIVYSVLLFSLLRRYLRDVKRQYTEILSVAERMAQGRLDASIQEDLGVFEPLGRQLEQVQEGFRQAVEEEVKSRSMKTELVANVSHDLKTPLTAIITYVGLLQEENITEEERRSYIETLDNKSQRLKTIIDDLFEMSRVSTGNVTLEQLPVDLPSLLRQVELELQTEIEASGVEFRHRFSEEKAMALLDGGKTSRIFQNLFVNVTKYAMPGTRAYVDLVVRGGNIIIKVSNVSRDPLELEGDITERFVRGDRSRNTEGSGLGLAIARSLTELQGGKLTISVDGDLFKAIVVFPASIYSEDAPPDAP